MRLMADAYEVWLDQVRDALRSINMPMADWQKIWAFDFSAEYKAGTSADTAANACPTRCLVRALRSRSIRRSERHSLRLKLPLHDLDRFNRVLAARLGLRANQIENCTHTLARAADATIAGLMNSDEILIASVRGLNKEVKQAVTGRKTVSCFGSWLYLTDLHLLIVFCREKFVVYPAGSNRV